MVYGLRCRPGRNVSVSGRGGGVVAPAVAVTAVGVAGSAVTGQPRSGQRENGTPRSRHVAGLPSLNGRARTARVGVSSSRRRMVTV